MTRIADGDRQISAQNIMSASSINSSVLLGKLALVTGGSGTIGRAIAQLLVNHGASVVLTARNLDKLQQAAASIEESAMSAAAAGSMIQCVSCDVSNEASVVALFETIDKMKQAPIDLLVNNAGINVPGATISLSVSDFERVMQVNVTGPFLCSREAMKRMQAKDDAGKPFGGRIINIGSLSAQSPRPDACPYTTSKFALLGLTKSLALDGRNHGISVGIIHPGNVVSDLLTEEMIRERKETEGFLSPEDVAECVLTMVTMPATANVFEMTVLPTRQAFVGRG